MNNRSSGTIPGVTGVILAGGQSSRMGSNKALLPYQGGRFIESIQRRFLELFDEVLLVTNSPEQYTFMRCRMVADRFPGMGALAGLHAGLYHSSNRHIFAVACDMPRLNKNLIRRLTGLRERADLVIPEGGQGLEPLHAVYARECLPSMEAALAAGQKRLVSFHDQVTVYRLPRQETALLDPGFSSFSNINTPQDYFRLRDEEHLQAERKVVICG